MRSRVALVLLAAACAAPRTPVVRAPLPPSDEGAELAAWLPEQADRCVVVRPGRLPSRRRGLLMRQSWADPNVWENDLDVTAYARAEAAHPDGRRALRSYFRFAGDPDQARARGRALPFRWEDDPCHGIACRRPAARWVDERTVEVAQYEWPAGGALATATCVRLARELSGAVEVAARARPSAPWALAAARLERTILADRRGVELSTTLHFARVADAERALEIVREASPRLESLQPVESRERVVERRGASVRIRDGHSYTDLELAQADERLDAAAFVHQSRRATPLPVAEVDVTRLDVVRHQLRLREAVLARSRGAARRPAAELLAGLLERAAHAHPGEHWLAERLARVWLSETGRPDAARALAERRLATARASDREAWAALRREALAGVDAAELAAALVEDGIADGGAEARRGAEDLRRLRADGIAYEWAESAWRLGRELSVEPAPVLSQGTLSRRGVLGALVTLARIGGLAPGGTLQVVVTTVAEHAPHAVGRAVPELVVTRGRAGGSIVIALLGTLDLVELRRLAEQIDPLVGDGPVAYAVWLREPGSAEGVRLRLEGVARADGVQLRRVSGALRGLDVAELDRLVARPLHELPPALFPPPELVLRGASVEDAAGLWRDAELVEPGACSTAGPIVRCRAPGRPERLTEIIVRLARGRGLLQPSP
ncbi:MAG: hypothetical protein KF729_14980 [Sandaracinaceae bacterium]|nr:hypothetical protein [Sandaracinaceae bacterium]